MIDDCDHGFLSYESNGTGSGEQVAFAKLATGLSRADADLQIVSFTPELVRMIVPAGARCRFRQ
jgi:hypothetical protein